MSPRRAAPLLAFVLAGCVAGPIELAHPVRFEGAHAISAQRLRAVVAAAIQEYSGRPGALDDAVLALRLTYASLGHSDAQIRVTPEGDGTIVFAISEGRAWTLAELNVTGCEAVPTDELRALYGREFLPDGRMIDVGFEAGDPFDAPRLDRWARMILARYVDAGYLDARLDQPLVDRDETTSAVRVTMRVAKEGPRYRLRAFDVPDALRALLGPGLPAPPTAEFCTRSMAEGYAARVVRALRKNGHPEPHLRVGVTRHEEAGEATFALTAEVGKPKTIAAIVVRGNRRVPTVAILDRLPLQAGARFDGDAERVGLSALSATGEFAQLQVDYEDVDPDSIRLLIDAVETTGPVVRGSHSYHPWRHLGYGLSLEGRDVLGERHDVVGEARIDDRGYRFGLGYLRSGLFDELTSLVIGGDFFYSEHPAFTDRGAGGSVELRRYVSPGIRVGLGYAALEHFETTFDARATTDVGRDYTEGRVALEVNHDLRDSTIQPTRGQRAFARVEHNDEALGADVEFTRLRTGAGIWLPLHDDWTWSIDAEAGWLWPGAGSRRVPVTERFFLGGHDTVRSFRESRLGPRDGTGALRGGEFRNVARTELQWRVEGPVQLVAFVDAGNIGTDVDAWSLAHMRWALGFGVRLAGPDLAPISVTAASNPDRAPGEDEWVVDFAAGVFF